MGAYFAAARILKRQEALRELRARRDSLQQVLRMADNVVMSYLEQPEEVEYPQREMVELERCALQAQIHYAGDLQMQKALLGITYPSQYRQAIVTLRKVIEGLESDIAAGRVHSSPRSQ